MWSLTKNRGEIQVWPLKMTDVGLVLEREKNSIQSITINQQIHFLGGKQPIVVHILLIGGIQNVRDSPPPKCICVFIIILDCIIKQGNMQHCKVSITYLCTTEVFLLRQLRTLRPPGIYLCISITWWFFLTIQEQSLCCSYLINMLEQ
jgi:hypothetical protein